MYGTEQYVDFSPIFCSIKEFQKIPTIDFGTLLLEKFTGLFHNF